MESLQLMATLTLTENYTNESTISDKNTIREVLNHPEESSDEEDDDDGGAVEMRKLLMEGVKSAIEVLEKFRLYSDFGEDVLKSVQQVSHFIE